jgi:ABC-type transporter Mla subunit MlaD
MEYFRKDSPTIKVGGFILAALVLLLIAALMVGNLSNLLAAKRQYTVLFKDAYLLPEGAQVAFAGREVGQVSYIEVRSAEERARHYPEYAVAVTISVRADAADLREGSRVEMKTNGMIGDRYIDILPGTGKAVPDGGMVTGSLGGLEGLLASFSGTKGGVNGLLTSLNALLTDTSRPDSIPSTLAKVNRVLEELQPHLVSLARSGTDLMQHVQQEVGSLSGQAGKVLQDLDGTLAENRPGLRRLVREMHTTVGELRHTMKTTRGLLEQSLGDIPQLTRSVQTLVEGVQQNVQAVTVRVNQLLSGLNEVVVANDRNIYVTVENLRDVTANLEAITEILRANPAVLVWGRRGNDAVPEPERSSLQRATALEDRGRMGRYDRIQ